MGRCKWCGGDTSRGSREYLWGDSHAECGLRAEAGKTPIRIAGLEKIRGTIWSADTRNIVVTEASENYRIFRIAASDGGKIVDLEIERWGEGGVWEWNLSEYGANRRGIQRSGGLRKGDITIEGIGEIYRQWWWDNYITPF